METCFSWGCSPSCLLYSKLTLFRHKLTFLKQECIKKKSTTNQGLPASSLFRRTAISSLLTAHTFQIRTMKGKVADQVRRVGRGSATKMECLLAVMPTSEPNKPLHCISSCCPRDAVHLLPRTLFILNDPWSWTKHRLQPIANLGSVPDQPINQNSNWALEGFFFYV